MKHSHGAHAGHGAHAAHAGHGAKAMSKQIAKGSVASASVQSGGKLISKAKKHPLLVFGLGIAAGYVIYKYRKEIIGGATKMVDGGKDFVLHQKENLEDIVAETKEES